MTRNEVLIPLAVLGLIALALILDTVETVLGGCP